MAFKVVLEVLLDVPEVVLVVLVAVLMSRCPFQRLQSAGQQGLYKEPPLKRTDGHGLGWGHLSMGAPHITQMLSACAVPYMGVHRSC